MYRQCPCDVQLRFQARLGIFDRKIGIIQVISPVVSTQTLGIMESS